MLMGMKRLFFITQQLLQPLVALHALLIAAIIGASIVLYFPVFQWLSHKVSLDYGYVHLLALLLLLGLSIYRLSTLKNNPFHLPMLYRSSLLLWVAASIGYLLNEAFIGMRTLSAVLFILYSYGLLGHVITTTVWRSMLLPVLLLVLVLPLEHYLDVYLGFPLRLLSAEWAGSALSFMHLPTLTTESIVMIDNRAAIVDLDCSGINSLWIGAIFYLALTWIEHYRITLRWLLIGLVFISLLVLANVVRIVILVVLELVLELPQLAMMLHQFLGLLGFIIACGIAWGLLHYFAQSARIKATTPAIHVDNHSSFALFSASGILSVIVIFALLYQPMSAPFFLAKQHPIQLPAHYHAQEAALSAQEQDFFTHNHAQVQKLRFRLPTDDNTKPLTGSMILVWSHYWKNQHVPENCYLGQGFSISEKGVWMLDKQADSAIRFLALNRTPTTANTASTTKTGALPPTQIGTYWFQSASKSTPDYASRVMDGVLNRQHDNEWVMVSILWDQAVNADAIAPYIAELKTLVTGEFRRYENQ